MQPDITLPKPIQIREYHALLDQSDSANPTATVLHNTLGDIVWTRVTLGVYRGDLANTFLPYNTTVIVSTSSAGTAVMAADVNEDSGTYYTRVRGYGRTSGSPTNGMNKVPIIIRVYET